MLLLFVIFSPAEQDIEESSDAADDCRSEDHNGYQKDYDEDYDPENAFENCENDHDNLQLRSHANRVESTKILSCNTTENRDDRNNTHRNAKLLCAFVETTSLLCRQNVTCIYVDEIHLELALPKKIVIPNILIPISLIRIELNLSQ